MKKKTIRKKSGTKKRFLKGKLSYLLVFVFLFLIYLFIQGDYGFLKYLQLSREKKQLLRRIEELQLQQQRIEKEIELLRSNYQYIEKVARDEYLMAKKGEKIYRINPPKKED